jgi:hypothetical protein
MGSKNRIDGEILWLKCSNCSTEFPTFVFSGDSDWVTDELRTSTALGSKTLFIYKCSVEPPGGSEVEFLECKIPEAIPGESFQEYQNRRNRTDLQCFYRCINCTTGKALALKNLSQEELSSKGYRLIPILSSAS